MYSIELLIAIDRRPVEYFPGGPDDEQILIANPKGINELNVVHDLPSIGLLEEFYALLIDSVEANSDEIDNVVGLDGDDEVGLFRG